MPGLTSATAAGLARRVTPAQWQAVETGLAAVTGRMLALLPAPRAAALTDGPVTIDLDTTDVEVYGRKKRGVAFNHQGQRVGRPHAVLPAITGSLGRHVDSAGKDVSGTHHRTDIIPIRYTGRQLTVSKR